MKPAETLTFGGSGLNRAADLRGNESELSKLRQSGQARGLPVWRGKPLLAGDARDRVGWLELCHSVFGHAAEDPVFLGLDETGPRFCFDVSSWKPENLPDTIGAFSDPSEQIHPELGTDFAFVELRRAMARLTPRDAELAATAKALLGWHRSHRFCSACGSPSTVANGGWQRDCPDCAASHFPRTDPVVIMLVTFGNRLLVGRSHIWPDGMYSLLAGFVEPGETIEAAVRREVFEEAGVEVGAVRYLASQPWPFPSSLMIGCHGQALGDQIRMDPEELEDAIWVSREEMMDVFAGSSARLKPARKGSIARFLIWNWLADRQDEGVGETCPPLSVGGGPPDRCRGSAGLS